MNKFWNIVLVACGIILAIVCLGIATLAGAITYAVLEWEFQHGMHKHFIAQTFLGLVYVLMFLCIAYKLAVGAFCIYRDDLT